jgi:hypothetical protein
MPLVNHNNSQLPVLFSYSIFALLEGAFPYSHLRIAFTSRLYFGIQLWKISSLSSHLRTIRRLYLKSLFALRSQTIVLLYAIQQSDSLHVSRQYLEVYIKNTLRLTSPEVQFLLHISERSFALPTSKSGSNFTSLDERIALKREQLAVEQFLRGTRLILISSDWALRACVRLTLGTLKLKGAGAEI